MAENNNVENNGEAMKLDDTARVKVLSPGQLVAKRFFRNKLAIVGLVIIVCMFLFSFVGGAIIPYSESQVFYTTEEMKKDYAGATYISDYLMYEADETVIPSDAYSKAILAITKNQPVVETRKDGMIGLRKLDDSSYIIYSAEETLNPKALKSDEHNAAVNAGDSYFEYDGVGYIYDDTVAKEKLYVATQMAVICQLSFTAYSEETSFSYEFYQNAIVALNSNAAKFEADGVSYTVENEGEGSAMIHTADGADYAYISNLNINNVVKGIFLTPDFKEAVTLAIESGAESFEYTDSNGETEEYVLSRKQGEYLIQRYQETRVIDVYASPSKEHWVGTDANGMDMLARLMYGGRISLLIGFVVVIIEVILGVIIGGVAGFFGGWVDNILMRLVDVIYCIPAMPLYLILGSIMDHYRADSTTRIYALCIMMSLIGWVGIARIVRGQILSLREQEFMVAAEATGISVKRRIFKHLIPNVIPQLIVFATMGLGDVILSEATLSFLGLGIKYPAASWGSIINAVNDSYVMTNYLFVWIPAGLLILLTVLAFNFIGDGLRDAFDPKMKR
jgi:peptide/nickel transport system permease protein